MSSYDEPKFSLKSVAETFAYNASYHPTSYLRHGGNTAFHALYNLSYVVNHTNSSDDRFPREKQLPYSTGVTVTLGIIFSVIMIGTMVGNILVCTAVVIVKKLRTPSNLLIVSLAVSDLLVSLLVMPFAISYELLGEWVLGNGICNMFILLDVTLCTASILNLCMISIDRYNAITRPLQYAHKRTKKRMGIMITIAWVISAVISIVPLFGFSKQEIPGHCTISQELGYQILATLGAFYLPLAIMIGVYTKIFLEASKIAKAENRAKGSLADGADTHLLQRLDNVNGSPPRSSPNNNNNNNNSNGSANGRCPRPSQDSTSTFSTLTGDHKRRRHTFIPKWARGHRSSHAHKERKATRTLGVIMGCFTLCWLPFFILAVVRPFCTQGVIQCHIPNWLSSAFTWLGYVNCFLNPLIYARFNREFRKPFKEILCLRCRDINRRMRSGAYLETYGVARDSRSRLGGGAGNHGNSSLYVPSSHSSALTSVRLEAIGDRPVVELTNGAAIALDETHV